MNPLSFSPSYFKSIFWSAACGWLLHHAEYKASLQELGLSLRWALRNKSKTFSRIPSERINCFESSSGVFNPQRLEARPLTCHALSSKFLLRPFFYFPFTEGTSSFFPNLPSWARPNMVKAVGPKCKLQRRKKYVEKYSKNSRDIIQIYLNIIEFLLKLFIIRLFLCFAKAKKIKVKSATQMVYCWYTKDPVGANPLFLWPHPHESLLSAWQLSSVRLVVGNDDFSVLCMIIFNTWTSSAF